MKNAKIWPYSIAVAIFLIFMASVATVMISLKAPVQESDLYMIDYHDADKRVNEILSDAIEFNAKYNFYYTTDSFFKKGTQLKYKLVDKNNQVVDGAKISVLLTRPHTKANDKTIEDFSFNGSEYLSKPLDLEDDGRWDIIAKVEVGSLSRYLSIKTSTLEDMVKEF
ncbi:MAG: FixH family protein [Sulfurimonas sp.]|jgi:nitrogen fixation protein FixH|nr:FixH family protein [Sulfurimonadaceae bacterium]